MIKNQKQTRPSRQRMLVVDTETGGTDPLCHSLLSVGLVVWTSGTVTAELEIEIAEDPILVTARAMEINGIDLVQHKQDALAPSGAVDRIANFVSEHFADDLANGERVRFVGHNVGFDIGFLKRLYRLADRPFDQLFSHRSVDTASILQFYALANVLPQSVTSSDGAFAYFGIAPPQILRHTALGDARSTAVLLTRLIDIAHKSALGFSPAA